MAPQSTDWKNKRFFSRVKQAGGHTRSSTLRCSGRERDADGRIKRDPAVRGRAASCHWQAQQFRRLNNPESDMCLKLLSGIDPP